MLQPRPRTHRHAADMCSLADERRATVPNMPATVRVHVNYPAVARDDDETWLDAVASRHHGDLAEERLLTHPMQRTATFRAAAEAASFVSELAASGRWKAHII